MARIFISYGREDEPFVRSLVDRLENLGHEPFYAGGSLAPGEDWNRVLSKSLADADAVIVVVSRSSSDSKWLLAETGAALAYWREKGKPIVLPLIIDDISIPAPFRNIQALFASDRNLDSISNQVEHALNAQQGRIQAIEERQREVQRRVEDNAGAFIKESLERLQKKEGQFRFAAYAWYFVAFAALVAGLAYGAWRTSSNLSAAPTWESNVQLALVSIVVVGVLGAVSRLAFILGKSFMVESLRNSDRIHAISFGEFYLKAYGQDAEWPEIKEAFQHWNIDKGSSFIQQQAKDVDPQVLQTALDIAKTITG